MATVVTYTAKSIKHIYTSEVNNTSENVVHVYIGIFGLCGSDRQCPFRLDTLRRKYCSATIAQKAGPAYPGWGNRQMQQLEGQNA